MTSTEKGRRDTRLSVPTPLCLYTARLMLLFLFPGGTRCFDTYLAADCRLDHRLLTTSFPRYLWIPWSKNLVSFVAADGLRGLATGYYVKLRRVIFTMMALLYHHRKPRSSPFRFALRMSSPRNLDGAPTHVQYSVITRECSAITCVQRSGPGEKRMRPRAGETGGQWFKQQLSVLLS